MNLPARGTDLLIVASRTPGEVRYALRQRGCTTDVVIMRDGGHPYGSIHLGRVVEMLSGGAALVDIGGARPGFLPFETPSAAMLAAAPGAPSVGSTLLVQVAQEERTGKGAKLSRHIRLAGVLTVLSPLRAGVAVSRYLTSENERQRLVAMVRPWLTAAEGVVIRRQAAGTTPLLLRAEIDSLRQRWQTFRAVAESSSPPTCLDAGVDPLAELFERALAHGDGGSHAITIVCDAAMLLARARALSQQLEHAATVRLDLASGLASGVLFQDIEDDIAAALEREVPLAGGGRLCIESTAALTAIDIDTAAAGLGAADAVNQAAVAAIAWQMRLRNLSGALVVDFIRRRAGERLHRVVAALRSAVAGDPLPVRVSGPSPSGLVEMIRDRRRAPLADLLQQNYLCCSGTPMTVGLSALRLVLREATAQRCAGLGLEVAPVVAEVLAGPLAAAVTETEGYLGHRLVIRTSPVRRADDVAVIVPS
ncbi:MAG: ribonuclease G [Rhodospirillaceae bacterium]|nr:MAG: ribonuclease G [Rhodospirillaceae bacterium]